MRLRRMSKNGILFDGQYYDQIDGVAMGSPLGPFWLTFSCATLKKNG